MRRYAANSWLWCVIAIVLLIMHLLWAYSVSKGHPIARCGATWIIVGGVVALRPIIRQGFAAWLESTRVIDGGHVIPTPEEIEAEKQEAMDALSTQRIGPTLAVIGTLMAGYGDLAWDWIAG